MLSTMTAMSTRLLRRAATLVVAVALGATACGADRTPPPVAAGVAPTPTIAPERAVDPPDTPSTTAGETTTTTTVPVDPYETFVANIVDEVEFLDAFVEPDGEPARFEFAITNPTYFGNPLGLMVTDRSDDGRWLKV